MSLQLEEIQNGFVDIGGGSFQSKSSFDQELEQRIVTVVSEVEKKSAQVEAVEEEIRILKASLNPLLGPAFIRRFFP